MVDESTEMTEDELIKLSYDVVDLPYTENYKDFNTNNDLLEIQDALFKTYERNPFDFIITLALIYRLRILGWDKQYINYVSENNKGFNILSAATNVNISKMNIEYLLKNNYINEDYNLTESGRIVLLLINHVSPVQANNLGNFYVPLSYYYNISSIDKNNFVNIKIDNQILYGIKDEFFVCKDALVTLSDKVFADDSDYNTFILNSTNNLHRGREIGYTPNINISDSESLDFEICQPLFNTFNNDVLDTLGGLIMIKPYNSKEPIYVNSLIFRLLKKTHYNISPFISGVNDEYVLFKDNVTNEIVGLIKTISSFIFNKSPA